MVFMVLAPWVWLLHVRVETRHVHAERHLAKAGVANGKVFERSFLGGPRIAWGSQNPKGEWPCRARGAEPTREAWFRMKCASAHTNYREGVAEGKVPQRWKRKTRSGWSAEETSSARTRTSMLDSTIQNRDELPTDGEAIRNILLRHRLRFHLFTQILLRRNTFFDTYLRCMSTLLRHLMPKRNR